MNTAPRVSVLIPFFDPPLSFFAEAVASVHAQTFTDWEMLLVDDGSAAPAATFAREHAAVHSDRVRYLEFPEHAHRGLAVARNLGLREARGDLMAPLDADDVWLPRKLEQQVAILGRAGDVGWVYGRTKWWYGWTGKRVDLRRDYVQPHGARGADPFVGQVRVDPPGLLSAYIRGTVNTPSMSSLMFRRSVALACGGADEAFHLREDYTFVSKLCLAAPLIVSEECWDYYRQHPESMCARTSRFADWRSRRQFAAWLKSHIAGLGVCDAELRWAMKRESWELRVWPAVLLARSLRRRVGRMVRGVRGRTRPRTASL